MKALVTGANGLIGANLVRELLRDGHQVTGLVRGGSDLSAIAGLPVRLVAGDVLDPGSLGGAAAGQDVVFHTAVAFSYWGHEPAELTRTATLGTLNILAAAASAGVRRVVMTSSTVTLGASHGPEVRDETASAAAETGESEYVNAKIAQERDALEAALRLGVEIVVACPTMSVGPFASRLGPSNGVITSYLADPMRLTWAGGCNIAAVEDVARGHLLLAERGQAGARYVLGGENLTWAEIHGLVADLAGVRAPTAPASAVTCYGVALAEEARAHLTGRPPSPPAPRRGWSGATTGTATRGPRRSATGRVRRGRPWRGRWPGWRRRRMSAGRPGPGCDCTATCTPPGWRARARSAS